VLTFGFDPPVFEHPVFLQTHDLCSPEAWRGYVLGSEYSPRSDAAAGPNRHAQDVTPVVKAIGLSRSCASHAG
jgi:hypothetical protein